MKIRLLCCTFLLLFQIAYNQTFYDSGTIQEIRIYFDAPDWQAQLNAEQQSTQNYIAAQSVVINGTAFANVGVKYKGNSSFEPFLTKNPFHISLDAFQNQDYQSYTDLKLSNVVFDPTFIRETLSYELLRQYMDAPLANYANVYVNDVLIGLYVNVESVSKKFVRKHFYSDSNAFFDCSPVNGANSVSSLQELPALIYWGNSEASYNLAYRIKSEQGWDDLIGMINTLNNNTANIESSLDIDKTLWMLAFDNIMVNIDSYIGLFNQNYYLYKDDNGRFNPVLWDLNMSFGVFADLGSAVLSSTTAKKQLNPLQHANDTTFPLVSKLLAIPRYKKMYLAHYYTILQENFANGSYLPKAQALHALVDAAVQADPNKLNSYAAFQSNINNDVATNNGLIAPGITNLANGRATFLSAYPAFAGTKPVIANVAATPLNPVVGSLVNFTAQITNANADAVFLNYRTNYKDVFSKVQLFDDGAHNDGAAADQIYGGSVMVTDAYLQYYLYAENNTIGVFSPARAAYEFYTLHATYPTIEPGTLAINEIMAQNTATVTDPAGQFEDWIELYNNSENTLSLDHLYLSDTVANLQKWQFPDGFTIAPHSYLVVWADEDLTEDGLHADFKLSAAGESVILSYPDGTIVDTVDFGAQQPDTGYARVPNGTGNFTAQQPTFNSNNENLARASFSPTAQVSVWPNPVAALLHIESAAAIASVAVYNALGQLIFTQSSDSRSLEVNTANWKSGIYTVKVKSNNGTENIKILKR